MAQAVIINGVTYNGVTQVKLPTAADTGVLAVFPDTTDATAEASDIAVGKTAYCGGAKITGTGSSGSGTAEVEAKDVNFYDYDGKRVAAYTVAEARALTSLPAGPSHDGLTFQGWNWSLADINAQTRAMNIGALYTTSDGKTRLYIKIPTDARLTVPLRFTQSVTQGVTVDWGDGSEAQTFSETGVFTTHTYLAAGDYVISLNPASGCTLGLSDGDVNNCVLGANNSAGQVYSGMLHKVELGNGIVAISNYCFKFCLSLSSVSMPAAIASMGKQSFGDCHSLTYITISDAVEEIPDYFMYKGSSFKRVSIPNSAVSIGEYAFQYGYSLYDITIPESVTTIGKYCFSYCYSLKAITLPGEITSVSIYLLHHAHALAEVTIPAGVTSIESNALAYTVGVAEYHFLSQTPPSLSNVNAFYGAASDYRIYVPAASLSAYQAATNWSTFASKIQGE